LFEAGQLKCEPRSGWLYAKIPNPESVADHYYRTAVMAFFLALEEGLGLEQTKSAAIAGLFHDFHETRLQDRHKISQGYFRTPRKIEKQVVREQFRKLDERGRIAEKIVFNPQIGAIVKDADFLELVL